MKNEDRIVELLAESLKRQDRMEQRLVELQQQNKLDNDRVVGAVDALADIVQA